MSRQIIYVIDTTALIDFAKGFEPSKSNLLTIIDQGAIIALCSITVSEFFTGLAEQERETWKEFFSHFAFFDISYDASIQAGIWRKEFSSKGIQLSTTDALIAAVAWQHHAILITSNTKHYPMPEVQLMSIRGALT